MGMCPRALIHFDYIISSLSSLVKEYTFPTLSLVNSIQPLQLTHSRVRRTHDTASASLPHTPQTTDINFNSCELNLPPVPGGSPTDIQLPKDSTLHTACLEHADQCTSVRCADRGVGYCLCQAIAASSSNNDWDNGFHSDICHHSIIPTVNSSSRYPEYAQYGCVVTIGMGDSRAKCSTAIPPGPSGFG